MLGWAEAERYLYWSVFAAAFLAVGLWETFRPLRALTASNSRRWATNIAIATLNQVTTLAMPIGATVVAMMAQSHPYGLLNRPLIPFPIQCILAITTLDFVRWVQHLAFHRVGFLWRIHRVHHSDADFDLTTGLRFHPAEAILVQGSFLGAVYVLAPPPVAVMGVGLVQVAQNFFGHANVSLPAKLDRVLRRFVVTPDLHRVHHSMREEEQNLNYGSIFPWWDRMFGTYRDEPADGSQQMRIGLAGYPPAESANLFRMLLQPFETKPRGS